MSDNMVVVPGLTPEWLEKRNGIMSVIDKQLVQELRRPGSGWTLDNLQQTIVQKGKILRPRSIIHFPQVPVNYDRDWNQTVSAAGPQTDADWDIRKVGDLYVAERKSGTILTNMTLVNFGEDASSEQVLEFGGQWNLGRTFNPWECFAVGERFPELHKSPAFFDPMAVVSLKQCTFRGEQRVCFVWFVEAKRDCYLRWFDRDWSPFFWFGFVSEL